jgi:uncharacterized membrane protein
VGWGIIDLIVVIGEYRLRYHSTLVLAGGSLLFSIWLARRHLLDIHDLLGRKMVLLPWRSWDYRPYSQNSGDEARNILHARYARGEITREQYESMMHDLEPKV